MAYGVLKLNDMPQIERRCPSCGGGVMMQSTGTLLHYEGTGSWGVEFHCTACNKKFPVWTPEYRTIIQNATAGVKPEKLEWRPLSPNEVMALRVLTPTRMPQTLSRCPECDGIVSGGLMRSTGRLLFDEVTRKWVIEYYCPFDGALFFLPRTSEQRKLIEDLTAGVEPIALPVRAGLPAVIYYIQRGGPNGALAVYRLRKPFSAHDESAFWRDGSWHEDRNISLRWVSGFDPGVDEVTEEEALEAARNLDGAGLEPR